MISNRGGVARDLSAFRAELREQQMPYQSLLTLNVWKTFVDFVFDWTVILLSVATVVHVSWWLAPLAILAIANRQRAIGNTLHDAGHHSLHRSRKTNDLIASTLVAPVVFADVAHYRDTHFKHHLNLGDSALDPDYLTPPIHQPMKWMRNLARNVFSLKHWWRSVTGHLGVPEVPILRKVYIVGWWLVVGFLLKLAVGTEFLIAFVMLWTCALATAFHLITMFREMCDHFGLQPGGVFSFTRDISRDAAWFWLIHPRNNGYHLTHHLLPAVPYYRLSQAHRLFSQTAMYKGHGRTCPSYFLGAKPVVADWQSPVGSAA